METSQAPEQTPASAQQAPAQVPASASVPDNLQAFVAPTSAPANAPAQVPAQPTAGTPDDRVAGLQRLVAQREVEKAQLEQRLAQLEQSRQATPSPEQNPYDPNVNWFEALKWEQNRSARIAAQEAVQANQKFFVDMAVNAYEQDWQRQHPDVSLAEVKAFSQQRGIRNIDDAYTLMRMPQTVAQAAQAGQQATLQQFTQPSIAATPVRPQAGGAQVPVGLSYEKMAQEFTNTNGRVYNSWSPEVQRLFDHETNMREAARREK